MQAGKGSLIEVVERFNSTLRKLVLLISRATKGTDLEARAEADKDLIFTVLSVDPTMIIETAGPKLYENATLIYAPVITSLDVLGVEGKYQGEANRLPRAKRVLLLVKDIYPFLTQEDKKEAISMIRDLLDIYLSYLEL